MSEEEKEMEEAYNKSFYSDDSDNFFNSMRFATMVTNTRSSDDTIVYATGFAVGFMAGKAKAREKND